MLGELLGCWSPGGVIQSIVVLLEKKKNPQMTSDLTDMLKQSFGIRWQHMDIISDIINIS